MRASEVFLQAYPGGVSIQECLKEIDRLAGQAAQLREALAGVTRESDRLRKCLQAIVDNPYLLTPDQWQSEARQALKGGAS